MNNTRFRECLELLGLSQVAAARLFRIGDRSVRRYAQEDGSEIPVPIAMALEMMVRMRIVPNAAHRWALNEEFEG